MTPVERPNVLPETDAVARRKVQSYEEAQWSHYLCRELGIRFETPCQLETESTYSDSPFSTVSQGVLVMPYAFDVNYSVSSGISETSPEELSRLMAAQWMVDYILMKGPRLQKLELPGIEEAWLLSAVIRDQSGSIESSWITMQVDGRLACLGVSSWIEEGPGGDATQRLITSLRRDFPVTRGYLC